MKKWTSLIANFGTSLFANFSTLLLPAYTLGFGESGNIRFYGGDDKVSNLRLYGDMINLGKSRFKITSLGKRKNSYVYGEGMVKVDIPTFTGVYGNEAKGQK